MAASSQIITPNRQLAITLAVTQVNLETLSSFMGKAVTVFDSPVKEICLIMSQVLSLLQCNANLDQAKLKALSGKSDEKWSAEKLEIKAVVADLQKRSPQSFYTLDEKSLDIDQLKKLVNDVFQAIPAILT